MGNFLKKRISLQQEQEDVSINYLDSFPSTARTLSFDYPPIIIIYGSPDLGALTSLIKTLSKKLSLPIVSTTIIQQQMQSQSLSIYAQRLEGFILSLYPSSVKDITEFINYYQNFIIIPIFIWKPLDKVTPT